jgi:serine/threonine protein kinase
VFCFGSCWRVKLGDFGSSVLMASDAEASVGGVWGTEGYRAPEVDAGLPHTPASDMLSLGVVLAYLIGASVDPANAAVSVQWAGLSSPDVCRVCLMWLCCRCAGYASWSGVGSGGWTDAQPSTEPLDGSAVHVARVVRRMTGTAQPNGMTSADSVAASSKWSMLMCTMRPFISWHHQRQHPHHQRHVHA